MQIYYQVEFITPWEPGSHSNKSAGGMCSQVKYCACERACAQPVFVDLPPATRINIRVPDASTHMLSHIVYSSHLTEAMWVDPLPGTKWRCTFNARFEHTHLRTRRASSLICRCGVSLLQGVRPNVGCGWSNSCDFSQLMSRFKS